MAGHPLTSIWKSLLLLATAASLLLPGAALAQRAHVSGRAASNAESLRIDWSKWPSGSTSESGAAIAPASADDPNKNFASSFHRKSYVTAGMQGGYLQQATVPLTTTGDNSFAWWLGSYYPSNGQAAAMAADAVTYLHAQSFVDQPCYLDDQPDCHLFILPIFVPGGIGADLAYAVWSDQNTVGELLIAGNSQVMPAHSDAVGHDFQQLLRAGDGTLAAAAGASGAPPATSPPAPAQPTITIDTVSVLRDVRGRLTPSSVIHVHELAFFEATFHVSGIGTYSPSGSMQFYYPLGNLRLIQNTRRDPLATLFDGPASLWGTPDGNPFFIGEGTLDDPTAKGQVTARFTLRLNLATDTKSATFTLALRLIQCKVGQKLKGRKCVRAKR